MVVVVCFSGLRIMKNGLILLPYVKEKIAYHIHLSNLGTNNPTDESGLSGDEAEDPSADREKPEMNEDVLVRDGLEEDASNGRFSIWKDYISLYWDVGAIGLSPGNYMPYIMENHPELYVVEYIRVNYPDKYESGIIHHVHSGYIMVYISAGILGFLCLAAFIGICLVRAFRTILKHQQLSYLFIGAFALVAAGAVAAVFDEGLFFQNNPHTTVFWFALGLLMKDDLAEAEVI
jgi:O-antigen ligase